MEINVRPDPVRFKIDSGHRFLCNLERIVYESLQDVGIDIMEIAATDAQRMELVSKTLRDYYARMGQSYLLLHDQQEDAEVRASRKYFVAKNAEDMICGVICIDLGVNELRNISKQFGIDASCLNGKVEFRRFVSLDNRISSAVSTALMASAARWSVMHGYQGVLALTRSVQRRFFTRFGLKSLTSASRKFADRDDGEYWLMNGDWPSIAVAVERFLLNNKLTN